jgi:signal transduction histidine kinase
MIHWEDLPRVGLHTAVNGVLFLLYVVLALSFYKESSKEQFTRHPFVVSVRTVFLLFSLVFLFNALLGSSIHSSVYEMIWFVLAAAPALLFFFMGHRWLVTEKQAKYSAERFNQMKDEFLTVASHELRTPLSVINGFAEILVREKLGPLNDEQKRRVRKILMQGQRLHRIIDDLLDLSRIRSGKIDVKSEVFALVPVLKAVLDDHEVLCDQQRLELIDEIPDDLPDVVGDLERVTQIVVNLLNNAIKYTDPGGTVKVSVRHEVGKGLVTVEVSDTGLGIDPRDQVHVFEEFYRANQQGSRKFSGSGLGLAIVRQLVEAQGGTVKVESQGLGKGSRFFFTLRVAEKLADHSVRPSISSSQSAVPRNSDSSTE